MNIINSPITECFRRVAVQLTVPSPKKPGEVSLLRNLPRAFEHSEASPSPAKSTADAYPWYKLKKYKTI